VQQELLLLPAEVQETIMLIAVLHNPTPLVTSFRGVL
jgi:hypothetical protein